MKILLIFYLILSFTLPEVTLADQKDYNTCAAFQEYCQSRIDGDPFEAGCNQMMCTDLIEGMPLTGELDICTGAETNDKPCCMSAENDMCKILLSPTGSTGIQAWIGFIYKISAITIGLAAVLMIVWAGFQMSYSGGSKDVGSAKKMIYNALYAIVLILLSGLILRFVNPDFFK